MIRAESSDLSENKIACDLYGGCVHAGRPVESWNLNMICMVSLLYSMLACHMLEQLTARSELGRQEASIADYRGPWIPLFCLLISCTKVCLIRHRTGDTLTVYNLLNTMHASCAICLYPASCYSNAKSPTFIIKALFSFTPTSKKLLQYLSHRMFAAYAWSIKCRRKEKLITQFGGKLRDERFEPN